MATGTEAKIINGLLEHLEEFTASPAIPVAWPDAPDEDGEPFQKPKDAEGRPLPYLQPFEIPVPTLPRALESTNEYGGVFQISLFWPQLSGVIAPEEIRSQILAHFAREMILVDGFRIQILQANRNGMLRDDPYNHFPMSIRYRAFATVSA